MANQSLFVCFIHPKYFKHTLELLIVNKHMAYIACCRTIGRSYWGLAQSFIWTIIFIVGNENLILCIQGTGNSYFQQYPTDGSKHCVYILSRVVGTFNQGMYIIQESFISQKCVIFLIAVPEIWDDNLKQEATNKTLVLHSYITNVQFD